jgi:YesN/AraC family two-component response regulator
VSAIDGNIQEIEFFPGTVLFTGKNGWAHALKKGNNKSFSIVFMDSYIRLVYTERVKGETTQNIWHHSSEAPGEVLLHIILALNKLMENSSERHASKALINALVLQVIEEIRNDNEQNLGKAEKTFKMVIEHMRQNYFRPVNREDICNELGLNPSYVSTLFSKHSGKNFNASLNSLRMEEAISILKNNPDIDIKTLSTQCGFSDHSYFIKVFKKYFGSTPGKINLGN